MSALPVAYATEVPAPYRTAFARPAGTFCPASAAASIIRDMPDPTAEQIKMLLEALVARVDSMCCRGCYDGLDALVARLLDAYLAVDDVVCRPDGSAA